MYTNWFFNFIDRHYWANSAQSTHHSYTDAGILALSGSADPKHLGKLVHSLIGELHHTASAPIATDELSRAKAQLESLLLMNLEMRPVMFEDIARQVLATGKRRQPQHWIEEISMLHFCVGF
ncbi:unnamed protein product [Protopolystoma xenopodis]|uniref:Peptidase M16 C-terminal domain-containing protein n=1 Tax=Protopolystoma xenopodis TaxID=117903 RepID=A0A448WXE4_9PLAT|nr:unnamed protein product [Protopolystoma xenopodis]